MVRNLHAFFLKHFIIINFCLILFLASFLRLYKLGSVPVGLAVDEASIGYNAYGILVNHRDEWLVRMPLSFKAFGEFKPPVAIYSAAVSISIFGLNHFAIRLPMALAGIATVIASFFISLKLFSNHKIALFTMLLVGVSPLNVHFSRIAFESSIGVALIAIGTACLLWTVENKRAWLLYFSGFIAFLLALYTNHSTKIIVPFVLMLLLIQNLKNSLKYRKIITLSFIVFFLLALPLLHQLINGSGSQRFAMISAISTEQGLKPIPEVIYIVVSHFLAHLDPRFLLFGLTDSYRHGNTHYGILSSVEFIFVIVGLVIIFRKKFTTYWWLVSLCIVAILPAAIGIVVPHPNRVHHLIPWVQVIASYGFLEIVTIIKKAWKNALWFVVIFFVLILLPIQGYYYYRVYTTVAAEDFQYGYKEMIAYLVEQENSVDKVYITSKYDHPYIYFLLYKKITPMEYHFGALNKYLFTNSNWDTELKNKKNVLIVAAPGEVPSTVPIEKYIYFPDGKVAFEVVRQ